MKNFRVLMIACAVCLLTLLPLAALAQTESPCDENAAPAFYVGQGDAYFESGDYTHAIEAYTCAIEADPGYAPAYVSRGYAYAAQRADPQAMADYNRALELDEGLVAGYVNRGVLYLNQGNFGLAINDLTLAIALDGSSAIAYNNRGVVHAAEGNYDLALADFRQAITLDPDYAAPHASLGAVYLALASTSFQEYGEIAGEHAPVPGGSAGMMLEALEDGQEMGDFSAWLALLTPARP